MAQSCSQQLREQHQEHLQGPMQEEPSAASRSTSLTKDTLHGEDSEIYQAVRANDQSGHRQRP